MSNIQQSEEYHEECCAAVAIIYIYVYIYIYISWSCDFFTAGNGIFYPGS